MRTRVLALVVVALAVLSGGSPLGQTMKTSRVMKDKLTHAQRVLEALTTSNYTLLDSEAQALTKIVDSPEWDELKAPEFLGYTDAFVAANRRLLEASQQRDLDAAAAAYQTVVASCYSCHKFRKAWRLAPARPLPTAR